MRAEEIYENKLPKKNEKKFKVGALYSFLKFCQYNQYNFYSFTYRSTLKCITVFF